MKKVRVRTLRPVVNNGVSYPEGKDDVLMELSVAQSHAKAGNVEILSEIEEKAPARAGT